MKVCRTFLDVFTWFPKAHIYRCGLFLFPNGNISKLRMRIPQKRNRYAGSELLVFNRPKSQPIKIMSQPSPEISGDRKPPAAYRSHHRFLRKSIPRRYTLQSRKPCACQAHHVYKTGQKYIGGYTAIPQQWRGLRGIDYQCVGCDNFLWIYSAKTHRCIR